MARGFGKVILLGEHAVVYGTPALAAALDRGAEAQAHAAPTSRLALGPLDVDDSDPSDLSRAFSALLRELGAGAFRVSARVEVTPGAGLGASAALGVAIARAVQAARESEDTQAVLAAALAWERVFHSNPSGIDTTVAALGGCLRFSRAEGPTKLEVTRPLVLAVGVAGPPSSTASMVAAVARLRERKPELVNQTFAGIESLVKNAECCIRQADHPGLGKLMDLNQMLLSSLFVSTEEIEHACRLARDAGALGAKLTGAGGGGSVIALVQGHAADVLAAWKRVGIDGFEARVG